MNIRVPFDRMIELAMFGEKFPDRTDAVSELVHWKEPVEHWCAAFLTDVPLVIGYGMREARLIDFEVKFASPNDAMLFTLRWL